MAITILDGGMGRELKRSGAPFRQPEWSALALIEAPDTVTQVHRAFAAAGAQVITTNSYALVPFHLGHDRFASAAKDLADLAGQLARTAACEFAGLRVAGSLPPLFGSYRPDLFISSEAPVLIAPLVEGLSPHVDLWLVETLSSTAEARAVIAALDKDPRPRWFSFTLADDPEALSGLPRLRSGEPIELAVETAMSGGAEAVLFNCSQPEAMSQAIKAGVAASNGRAVIGVYANAFPPQKEEAAANEDLLPLREDLDPPGYLAHARQWVSDGASIIGGCCGIGPEHIAELAKSFSRSSPPAPAPPP